MFDQRCFLIATSQKGPGLQEPWSLLRKNAFIAETESWATAKMRT